MKIRNIALVALLAATSPVALASAAHAETAEPKAEWWPKKVDLTALRQNEARANPYGDDFNYADLIAGDGKRYSHALLGIFAAIAPAASQALEALAEGDTQTYHRLLAPTVPLSREIFRAPTRFYKAGIAYLSWLNGHQTHFIMPAGFQSSRDITHYAQVFRLADQAGLLSRPDLAEPRMKTLLSLHGIDQT